MVTGFEYSTHREPSQYTGSTEAPGGVYYDYDVTREFGGGDITTSIVDVLLDKGIRAVAKKEWTVDDLNEGELLPKGAVNITQVQNKYVRASYGHYWMRFSQYSSGSEPDGVGASILDVRKLTKEPPPSPGS